MAADVIREATYRLLLQELSPSNNGVLASDLAEYFAEYWKGNLTLAGLDFAATQTVYMRTMYKKIDSLTLIRILQKIREYSGRSN